MGAVKAEMTIICAWCGRQRKRGAESRDPEAWLEPADVPEDESLTSTRQKVSHGICPECIAIQRAELVVLREVQKVAGVRKDIAEIQKYVSLAHSKAVGRIE